MGKRNPRMNYKVVVTCLDCRAEFSVLKPDVSLETTLHGVSGIEMRHVLLTLPDHCPKCHNIRLVKND